MGINMNQVESYYLFSSILCHVRSPDLRHQVPIAPDVLLAQPLHWSTGRTRRDYHHRCFIGFVRDERCMFLGDGQKADPAASGIHDSPIQPGFFFAAALQGPATL